MAVEKYSFSYYLQSSFDPIKSININLTQWKDKQSSTIKRFWGHNAVTGIGIPIIATLSALYHTILGLGKIAFLAIETPIVVLSANYLPYIAPEEIRMAEAVKHLRRALINIIDAVAFPVFDHSLTNTVNSCRELTYLFSTIEKVNDSKASSMAKSVTCLVITTVAVPTIAIIGAVLQPFLLAIGLGVCTLQLPITMNDSKLSRWMFEPQYCALRLRLMVKLVMTAIATPILGILSIKKAYEFNEKLGVLGSSSVLIHKKAVRENSPTQKMIKMATIGGAALAVGSSIYVVTPILLNEVLLSEKAPLTIKITISSSILGLIAICIKAIFQPNGLVNDIPILSKAKDFKAIIRKMTLSNNAQKFLEEAKFACYALAIGSLFYGIYSDRK